MKKVIYFTDLKNLKEAIDNFDISDFVNKEVPIKLHMGEIKNKYYPKPDFVKIVINDLKNRGIKPYLFDTTVAYPGLRSSKTGYKKLARIHGFTNKKVGCDVVIDDTGILVEIEKRDYEVAEHLYNSTHIFAISHVKGHNATGMGGAIKNFGMGGVTKETKIRMHRGSKPIYKKDKCTYCGICAEVCPFNSIKIKNETWTKNSRSCFGCGVCVNACENDALEFEDADFQFVLACAAKAVVQNKNVIYLNDVNRITKSCDCDPFSGPIIAPDIGYLVSDDPVAIDKASLDLIHEVKPDIFEKENHISPFKQIDYGEDIRLGTTKYQLIDL